MFVQTEFNKSNNNNELSRSHEIDSVSYESSLFRDLDLISRFCMPICSRDNEIREVALDVISKTVEGWLDGVGSPKHYRLTASQNDRRRIQNPSNGCACSDLVGNNVNDVPKEYLDLVSLHLPIILRLSISCPFINVREKCQHILEIVQSRGLPIPYPVISGPSAYIDPEEVALIMGVAGACRSDELCKMSIHDLEVNDEIITVDIPHTKTGTSRRFVIIEPNWIRITKKYIAMRPADQSRFFLSIRNGKVSKQPIGHNMFGGMPKKIASFLKLENPHLFTGHCFRRTSATALALQGGGILDLKRHGGWKSSTIAESYVDDCLESKRKIAKMVQVTEPRYEQPGPSSIQEVQEESVPVTNISNVSHTDMKIPVGNLKTGITIGNCTSCTFTFNFNKN